MVSQRVFSAEAAREVGDRLGADWTQVNPEQFRIGMEVELEHGVRNVVTNLTSSDLRLTGRIALAHLMKFPDYYDQPAPVQDEAHPAL